MGRVGFANISFAHSRCVAAKRNLVYIIAAIFWCVPFLSHALPIDPLPPKEMEARLQLLEHTPWAGPIVEENLEWDLFCYNSTVDLDVIDPLTQELKRLRVQITRPDVRRKVPVVIIVPTIKGSSLLESAVASQLCDHGIASVISDVMDTTEPREMPSWETEDINIRYGILGLRTTLDFVQQFPAFEPDQVGVMGLSLGGIVAGLLATVEPERLRSVVIAVGGGNLPYILANSEEKRVRSLRERRMKHTRLPDKLAYEMELRKHITFDSLYFAPRAQTKRVFMIMADQDKLVPYSVQRDLHTAFGEPKFILHRGGHMGGLIGLVLSYMDPVIRFMKASFADDGQPFLAAR